MMSVKCDVQNNKKSYKFLELRSEIEKSFIDLPKHDEVRLVFKTYQLGKKSIDDSILVNIDGEINSLASIEAQSSTTKHNQCYIKNEISKTDELYITSYNISLKHIDSVLFLTFLRLDSSKIRSEDGEPSLNFGISDISLEST